MMHSKTSLTHFNGKEQAALRGITATLKDRCAPLLLYLFKSKLSQHLDRNYFSLPVRTVAQQFECSLLMITEDASVSGDEVLACSHFGRVDMLVLSLSAFTKELLARNIFCCWIQKEAILLCNCEKTMSGLPPAISGHRKYWKQIVQRLSETREIKITTLGYFNERFCE